MADNEIIKAWDILAKFDFFGGQRAGRELWNQKPVDVQNEDIENFSKDVAFLKDFINRQNAEIEKLNVELVGMRGACESYKIHYDNAQAEIEILQKENVELGKAISNAYELNKFLEATRKCVREEDMLNAEAEKDNLKQVIETLKNERIVIELDDEVLLKDFKTEVKKEINTIKSEAYREVAEKITEVFMQYAHIHHYAEGARTDYIEAVDGTKIEMQSVWDVCTLEKNGMAQYEEMGRLQKNIETDAKERLLTELEKDFRLLAKELTESNE